MNYVRTATSPQVARVVDLLDRAYGGDAWHGPSLTESLADVSAKLAAARPLHDMHSIWEIVLHVIGWKHEVCRRVEGADPGMPSEGDWPDVKSPTDSHWASAREELENAHRRLIAATRLLPESRLVDMVGAHRDRPLGTGVTFFAMLMGAVQHDVYHAGQIVLLKKVASEMRD